MVLTWSVSVQAQLQRGEHISLIFVQCWEKSSLHSLGHRHGASRPLCSLGQVDGLLHFIFFLLIRYGILHSAGRGQTAQKVGLECPVNLSQLEASRKPAYTMISLVILGCLTLCSKLKPQIMLNWDISLSTCISNLMKDIPGWPDLWPIPGYPPDNLCKI